MTTPGVIELMTEAADALRREGQLRIADDLLRKRAVQPRRPVIVIAGAPNSGKASLVNALLRRRDLLPAGAHVVTSAPISLFYTDPERAAIVRYGEHSVVAVDVATALDLATVQGNPHNPENVRAVQLGVTCPLLERVAIIDAPSVGGLASGYADLTLQSLRFADALLFLTEAGPESAADEIEFLRRAVASTDTIIVAMTKIDAHDDWQAVRDAKAAKLIEQVPRLANCPFVAVDSQLALSALDVDDLLQSAAQRHESGFNTLEDTLRTHVIDCAPARFEADQLGELIWPLAAAVRNLTEPVEPLGPDAEWSQRLDAKVRELVSQRADDCARGLAAIRSRYDARLTDLPDADHDCLPAEFLADLTGLAAGLNEAAAKCLVSRAEQVLDEIDPVASIRKSLSATINEPLPEHLASMVLANPLMTHYDKLAVLSSFGGQRTLGTNLAASGLGLTTGPIVAPATDIAVGLGLGAVFEFQPFEAGSPEVFVSRFRDWMNAQCDRAQLTVGASLEGGVGDLVAEIRDAVDTVLAEREAQTTAAALPRSDQQTAAEPGLVERRDGLRGLLRRAVGLVDTVGQAGRPR